MRRIAALAVMVAACVDRGGAPARAPADVVVNTLPSTVNVGTDAGAVVATVFDASRHGVPGVIVTFMITVGGGRATPSVDTTDALGVARTKVTVGTQPGANEVSVIVPGLAPVKLTVTGTVGSARRIAISPRILRFAIGVDSLLATAVSRDAFGNPVPAAVVWTARDPSLIDVAVGQNNSAGLRVLRRPGQTYVVAANDGATDSVLAVVPESGFPCVSAASSTLAVGELLAFDAGQACIHAADANAEYALIVTYATTVANVSAAVDVASTGVVTPTGNFPVVAAATAPAARDLSFERTLRQREEREMPARVAGARAWFGARPRALVAPLREGDVIPVNVDAFDFCSNPDLHGARVVAITGGAIVLADTANPAGGFTDAEYRDFGVAMDTLVNPVDTGAFGAPSDIDNNGRVIILFTRAVNALTPRGSPSGIILGFYYSRDLLPRTSPFGDCAGSNVAEMFYILVPDPNGTVNGNVRSKAFVQSAASTTLGHEYQHLINASRRMYVNDAPRVTEEVWLNEGLSHIAEELLFFRASGRTPRQNIDESALVEGSSTRTLFDVYHRNNFARYREMLRAPETTSPLALDDRLATRGAAWSFLRYLADRARPTDGDFWRRLVNSRATGVPNLDDVLAPSSMTTAAALRDWSISVLADDEVPGTPFLLQQPSWKLVTAMPAAGLSFPLSPRLLLDGARATTTLIGGGTLYARFSVAQNKDAFFQVTGFNGGPLAPGMRLSVLRIR